MANKFCYEYEKIENYDIAKKENFKSWQCHHRLETHTSDGIKRRIQITRAELIALDVYYNRPASELILLRLEDHTRIHATDRPCSESQKLKTSEKLMGHKVSEETRRKISKKLKGVPLSEETKKKISESTKGGNRTSFKKGQKKSEEMIKKQKETSRKNMAIKTAIYNKSYKNIMTWNEFQTFFRMNKREILSTGNAI